MLKDSKKMMFITCTLAIGIFVNSFIYADVGEKNLDKTQEEVSIEKEMIAEKNITRAEFIKMIVNILELENKIGAVDVKFDDVSESNIYYPYIKVAYNSGIAQGDGQNFKPNEYITREEMATIISRAVKLTGSVKEDEGLKDMEKVSKWAKVHVLRCIDNRLIIGDSEGYFNPQDYATKEMATVTTMRAYEKVKKNKIDIMNRNLK